MTTAADGLTQWLRDAHAMEKQAEQILLAEANRIENYPQLKARIEDHLKETREQARKLETCIKARGGSTSVTKDVGAQLVGLGQAISGIFAGHEIMKGTLACYTFEHMEICVIPDAGRYGGRSGRPKHVRSLLGHSSRGRGDGRVVVAASGSDHPSVSRPRGECLRRSEALTSRSEGGSQSAWNLAVADKMNSTLEEVAARQRRIQAEVAEADAAVGEEPPKSVQAGAREYPITPLPMQHQDKPGFENNVEPSLMYDAPFYEGPANTRARPSSNTRSL